MQPLHRAVLAGAVLTTVSLAVTAALGALPAQAHRVIPASAPMSSPTAYAVIGTLATPTGQAGHIAILNADDADYGDDTIFVAAGTDVLVFRPGATTGSVGSGLGLNGTVHALTASDVGIYASHGGGNTLSRFSTSAFGPSAALSTTSLPALPSSVAVGGAGTAAVDDDSVYVVYYNGRTAVDSYSTSLVAGPTAAITLSDPQPSDVVVGGGSTGSTTDDTVYVVGNGLNSGTVVQLPPNLSSQIGLRPGYGIATAVTYDDSLVIGPGQVRMRALKVANWDDSVTMGANGGFIGVSRQGMVASYNFYSSDISFVPVGSAVLDDTVGFSLAMYSVRDVAFAADGVAYATASSNSVALIDKVTSAVLDLSAAAVGSSVQVSLTLQSGRMMDDSTVSAVWVGDDSVSVTRVPGQNAVSFTVPGGSGPVSIVAQLRGGNAIDAGTLTISGVPPAPQPPVAASAPRDVTAVAGDASASVSWSEPSSYGSYAISHYRVVSSPGDRSCLVAAPSTSCAIVGLTNGTSYTFTASALTGAGWSPFSDPSKSVTPRPAPNRTIVISGSREGPRIAISGDTTGMDMGGLVTPWSSRSLGAFRSGNPVELSEDGRFDWSRRAGRAVVWRVYFTAEGVKSNTVTMR